MSKDNEVTQSFNHFISRTVGSMNETLSTKMEDSLKDFKYKQIDGNSTGYIRQYDFLFPYQEHKELNSIVTSTQTFLDLLFRTAIVEAQKLVSDSFFSKTGLEIEPFLVERKISELMTIVKMILSGHPDFAQYLPVVKPTTSEPHSCLIMTPVFLVRDRSPCKEGHYFGVLFAIYKGVTDGEKIISIDEIVASCKSVELSSKNDKVKPS